MSIRIERLVGPALAGAIPALSRLRLDVFREWPYLYDGDAENEAEYLAGFAASTNAIIVAALDQEEIVGAATAAPLMEHTEEFAPMFAARGYDPQTIFYCGESVLLPAYRSRGIGHAFFDCREDHAACLNAAGHIFTLSSFCGVIRDASDPRSPPGYRPLDDFWERRGYRKVDGLIGHYDWRETGEVEETRKDMQFWMRAL
ncbi:MAG: GNAT family N-acetyltransferase [Hyphomicrobiaceae bacterium]